MVGIARSPGAGEEEEYAGAEYGKGSVVGYAQRGRRVVAGSRLAREAVPSAGSTGWCLVESPDDESPSGPPRNEEGHGRCLSRFSVMVGLGRCARLQEQIS